jgi:hypothetical protein
MVWCMPSCRPSSLAHSVCSYPGSMSKNSARSDSDKMPDKVKSLQAGDGHHKSSVRTSKHTSRLP